MTAHRGHRARVGIIGRHVRTRPVAAGGGAEALLAVARHESWLTD